MTDRGLLSGCLYINMFVKILVIILIGTGAIWAIIGVILGATSGIPFSPTARFIAGLLIGLAIGIWLATGDFSIIGSIAALATSLIMGIFGLMIGSRGLTGTSIGLLIPSLMRVVACVSCGV